MAAVRALRGGGQAKRVGGEEHLRDDGVLGRGEVVDFIVDHEREAVAVALGVDVGRVVCSDGERRDFVVAAAQQADRDRGAEGIKQDRVPLFE